MVAFINKLMSQKLLKISENLKEKINFNDYTPCPLCHEPISVFPGTRDAICQNCGYKEPCCD